MNINTGLTFWGDGVGWCAMYLQYIFGFPKHKTFALTGDQQQYWYHIISGPRK